MHGSPLALPHGTGVPAARAAGAAFLAAGITIPHALALGLIAFGSFAGQLPVAALALWSAALPGLVLALLSPRSGLVYAPTTVVALLFATVVTTMAGSAGSLHLTAPQVLAVCGATVALAFAFQWLFGVLRFASLARFLPISVTQGFAAGVGIAMVVTQVVSGFGAGYADLDAAVLRHAAVAFGVVVLAYAVQRRWPRVPGLLPAVAAGSVLIAAGGFASAFAPAVRAGSFSLPPMPDYSSVPWLTILQSQGVRLVSLAVLTAIVNSLDVIVFHQELELEHGMRCDANAALRRESLTGVAFALLGLIPASTSASRSRIALAQGGGSPLTSPLHGVILLAVAITGHAWLPHVPMACLAGALVMAGIIQVPKSMWSYGFARAAPAIWSQSWLVAVTFALAGGVGALVAGLVVATFVLLHATASTALRRSWLQGELRSRRLRGGAQDAWLAAHMREVAVFELQGVMSFGVAAYLAEQIRGMLDARHRRVILDASRVPAWDGTATARLGALGRDLGRRGVELCVCGLNARDAVSLPPGIVLAADLDRALERMEDALLAEQSASDAAVPKQGPDVLAELSEGVSAAARAALESRMAVRAVAPGQEVFAAQDTQREMLVVRTGRITLSTGWPPASGLRLATVGVGMAFGEMAFLNGQRRTAWAGAEDEATTCLVLSRGDFDDWAAAYPRDALAFMGNLAQIGTRRLAATTRQLRAILE